MNIFSCALKIKFLRISQHDVIIVLNGRRKRGFFSHVTCGHLSRCILVCWRVHLKPRPRRFAPRTPCRVSALRVTTASRSPRHRHWTRPGGAASTSPPDVCPFGLRRDTPCVAIGFEDGRASLKLLDRGVQLAGIDSQFHALLLRLGKCEP